MRRGKDVKGLERALSFPSPFNLFLKVLFLVFIAEVVVMFILALWVPSISIPGEAIIDAVLLTVLSSPFIWWLVVKPLKEKALTERLRASIILNNTTEGIITFDSSGIISFINPSTARLLGYSSEEMVGQPLRIFLSAHYEDTVKGWVEEYLKKGESSWIGKPVDVKAIRKGGKVFPAEIIVSPYVIEGKCYFSTTIHDISERIEIERKVVRLSRLYSLMSRVNEAIVHNRSTEKLYKEVCNMAIEDDFFRMAWIGLINEKTLAVHPVACSGHEEGYLECINISIREDVPEGRGPTGRAIREGRPVICNNIEDKKCHMTLWLEEAKKRGYQSSAAFPLKLRERVVGALNLYSGEPYFFDEEVIKLLERLTTNLSFAIEAIENEISRRQAQEELYQSQRKFETLVNSIDGIVWELDVESFRFTFVSKQAERILGYPVKQWFEEPDFWQDHLYPDDREWAVSCYARATEEKEDHSFEYRMVSADGRIVWIRDIVSVVMENNRAVKLRGVMIDITENKKLEDQLRQAQKMEAIGQLASGIAHDFNNILTAIVGYTNLLHIKVKDNDLKGYISQIMAASEKASSLTRGLLTLGRKQVMNFKPVDINEVIKSVEMILLRLIEENIKLVFDKSQQKISVLADPGQIEQVLFNLVTNARDAMPDGGQVFIDTGIEKLSSNFISILGPVEPGRYGFISVRDTGAGIEDRIRDRIFEPFFTTKEVGKGTGLGLSVVYNIVKQHNGYINVESKPGMGTTFKIYLPLSVEDHVTGMRERSVSISGGVETILVVDDDENVRNLIGDVLKEFGYTVLLAKDGDEAIRIFEDNKDKIDPLMVDLIMPGKNGKIVHDEVKKIRPGVKILFTSGYSEEALISKGILKAEEKAKVIYKPVSPVLLLRAIRGVLDG